MSRRSTFARPAHGICALPSLRGHPSGGVCVHSNPHPHYRVCDLASDLCSGHRRKQIRTEYGMKTLRSGLAVATTSPLWSASKSGLHKDSYTPQSPTLPAGSTLVAVHSDPLVKDWRLLLVNHPSKKQWYCLLRVDLSITFKSA